MVLAVPPGPGDRRGYAESAPQGDLPPVTIGGLDPRPSWVLGPSCHMRMPPSERHSVQTGARISNKRSKASGRSLSMMRFVGLLSRPPEDHPPPLGRMALDILPTWEKTRQYEGRTEPGYAAPLRERHRCGHRSRHFRNPRAAWNLDGVFPSGVRTGNGIILGSFVSADRALPSLTVKWVGSRCRRMRCTSLSMSAG
jgi:hypothetical protein